MQSTVSTNYILTGVNCHFEGNSGKRKYFSLVSYIFLKEQSCPHFKVAWDKQQLVWE